MANASPPLWGLQALRKAILEMRKLSATTSAAVVLSMILSGKAVHAQDKKPCKSGVTTDGRRTLEGTCIVPVFDDEGNQVFMVRLQDGLMAQDPPGGIELMAGVIRAVKSPGEPRIRVRATGSDDQAIISPEDTCVVYKMDGETIAVRSEAGETLVETSVEGPQKVPQMQSKDDWVYFILTDGDKSTECAVRWTGRPPKKKNGALWLAVAAAIFFLAVRRKTRARRKTESPP